MVLLEIKKRKRQASESLVDLYVFAESSDCRCFIAACLFFYYMGISLISGAYAAVSAGGRGGCTLSLSGPRVSIP